MKDYPHLHIEAFCQSYSYDKPRGGGAQSDNKFTGDRAGHGKKILADFKSVEKQYCNDKKQAPLRNYQQIEGIVLDIESTPDIPLALQSLDNCSFQLLNVNKVKNDSGKKIDRATVYIEDGRLADFEKKILDYQTKKNKNGLNKNYKLVDSIGHIRKAALVCFWQDSEPMPKGNQRIWWEIWLRIDKNNPQKRENIERAFQAECRQLGIELLKGRVEFPEHTVVNVRATTEELEQSIHLLNCIDEIRKPRGFTDFLDNLPPAEQREWIDDFLSRVQSPHRQPHYLSLLDTGLNRSNPLLSPFIKDEDNKTICNEWGTADDVDHGTAMASIILFGDLADSIGNQSKIDLLHGVKSVKIIPPHKNSDEKFAAYYTQQGVKIAEQGRGSQPLLYLSGYHN